MRGAAHGGDHDFRSHWNRSWAFALTSIKALPWLNSTVLHAGIKLFINLQLVSSFLSVCLQIQSERLAVATDDMLAVSQRA